MLCLIFTLVLATTFQPQEKPVLPTPGSSPSTMQVAVGSEDGAATVVDQQNLISSGASTPVSEPPTPKQLPQQSEPDSQRSHFRELPDKPLPNNIVPREGCPDVDTAPCGNYGGFRFFRNTTLTEHDKTWRQAMSHPSMYVSAALLIGSTVLDAEGTLHCLQYVGCSELNPLLGRHPSRARIYLTAMPINALGIYGMGRLKQRGHGRFAFTA